jgi:hypothetical protein
MLGSGTRLAGVAGSLALAASLLAVGPVAAGSQHGLHLTLPAWSFTSFTCLNPDCTLGAATTDGTASSNVAGDGLYHADLVVDFSPGGTCNIVDETDTFTFAAGTFYAHSVHEDCRITGNRIDAEFTITGGTGAFAGASGGGKELGNNGHDPIKFNGQIVF